MSDLLKPCELEIWMRSRAQEAARIRPEIFDEPERDIQLSEIKERLQKLSLADKKDCDCNMCQQLRDIIQRIEKAEKRTR